MAALQQQGGKYPRLSDNAESNPSVSHPPSPQIHPASSPNVYSHGRQPQPGHPYSTNFRRARSSGDGNWIGMTTKSSAGASTLVILGLLIGSLLSFICTSTWILAAAPLGQGLPGLPGTDLGISTSTMGAAGRRSRSMASDAGARTQQHSTVRMAAWHQEAKTATETHAPEADGAVQQRRRTAAVGERVAESVPQHSPGSAQSQGSEWLEKAQHRPEQQDVQQPGGISALNMGLPEAQSLAALFFSKVFPADAPRVPEMQRHPLALHLMSLLRRLWQAHAATAAAARPPRDHCSTRSGAQLLQQVLDAAEKLQQESCSASAASLAFSRQASSSASPSDPGLPFVILRRISILVLHLAYQQGSSIKQTEKACVKSLNSATPQLLLSFSASFNCSRSARVAMELLHISKSGGTSMCQLAGQAGLMNPGMDINANCLLPQFGGDPKWTQTEDFMQPQHHFWAAVDCKTWVQETQMTCAERASRLFTQGVNFYANEHTLHEGNGSLVSAVPCPQVETVTVLRQPLERVRSHVIEVDRVYGNYRKHSMSYVRGRDLQDWQRWAPAVLDNYMTRSLLGRHAMCSPFGSLGDPELLAALLTLSSVDHVLLLEEDSLNELVIRAGMGWNHSLSSKHWRSAKHDLTADLNFPSGTMQQLEAWNLLDQDLYQWGKVLLRLDAAFHTAAAAITGREECSPASTAAAAAAAGRGEAEADAAPGAGGAAAAATPGAPSIDKVLAHIGMKRVNGNVIADAGAQADRRLQILRDAGGLHQLHESSFNGARYSGDSGDRGDRGYRGDRGDSGYRGDRGDSGYRGDRRDSGDSRDSGDRGSGGSGKMSVRLISGFANVDMADPEEAGSRVPLVPALLPAGLEQLLMGGGACARPAGAAGRESGLCYCNVPAAAGGQAQQYSPSSSVLTMKLPLYSRTRSAGA